MAAINGQQIKKIYAIGNALGIVERGNEEDALHSLVAAITGKGSVRALTSSEAQAVINDLQQRQGTPPPRRKPKTHTERPGGATAGQQRKVWALLYELQKADTALSRATLGQRLCGVLKKELHIDALPKEPFAWIDFETCNRLIEMLFKLNAQANSGFKGAFSQAQAEFAKLGSQIQSLNRAQGDISAYQKQQAAIDRTQARLENLTKQHALLGQQIQNTTGDTSALEREQLKLEQRMVGAQSTLENQQGRLSATTQRLEEAGVSMGDLSGESARLASEIQELSQQQEAVARSAEEYGESAVSAFDAAASALAAAGIVGGIKQIGEAYIGTVQAAGEFGATMSNAEALSGASTQQMALLTAQAKELGATTKFTANESGEAMGYMGMAGWNAQQMLAGMPGVLDLAAASGEDLAGVADIVTDSLTGFKLTAADTGEFVDVLAAASTKSNTNVSMLGESFKYVAPLAGTLGYSAQDTAVALGLMANSGIKAGQAGTTLRTALTNLVSPTDAQAAEMERLGISLTDSNGQMLPMLDMVGNLRGAFSSMSEAQQSAAASTLFGKEAMSGMLAVINASEADYQSLTQSIYNSAGAAQRMAEIKLDNLSGDLTLMQSAADGLGLTIGEVFMPQIRGLVQAGTGVLTWANEMIEAHPVMAKAILGAAGAVGVLTTGIVAYNAAQKVMAAFDLAALFTGPVGPILAVGAAVGAVTAGVMGLIDAANEGVPQVGELTKEAQEAAGAMEQVSADFDAAQVNILATADVAGTYIARLDELGAKTNLTKAESQVVISLPLRKSGTTGALGKVRPLASRRLERIGLIMKNHDEKAREFIDLLTIRGILGDKKIKNEDMRVQKQEKARNSYHNTLLLLQQYRTLVWLMECFPETVAEELNQPFQGIDELLEQMDLTLAMGNRRMENRLEGTKKTRILLDRVNEALTVLKKKPGDGKRLYQILYLTYITPEPLSHAEILYRLEMSSRNYYRLRQQAITILSIRLWSAPSTDVDFWLEMLEFLEKME